MIALGLCITCTSRATEKPVKLQARELLRLPLNSPRGIPEWDPSQAGEGVPTSWLLDNLGRLVLLVPHSRTLLRIDLSTGARESIELKRTDGGPLPEKAFLFDLAIGPHEHFYILDKSGGWVVRFDPKGLATHSFGHALASDQLEVAPDGNVLVSDAALSCINVFDPKGAFLGEILDPLVSPVCSATGSVVRSRLVGSRRAFVWQQPIENPHPRLVAILEAHTEDAQIRHIRPLGFLDDDRLVMVTRQRDANDKYRAFVHVLSTANTASETFEISPFMERIMELPRPYRLTKDGRVLTFVIDAGDFVILAYELHK